MPRFFKSMDSPASVGETVIVDGQDASHIRRSLRMAVGDRVVLCDGRSTEYDTVIDGFGENEVRLLVQAVNPSRAEPTLKLTLYQGLPKGDKMEWIIQKAVELGVTEIVPVVMSRSIAKLSDKADKKCARWQTIADEAAGQSGRGILPRVSSPLTVKQALVRLREENAVVCYENGGKPFVELIPADTATLSLVIGPEGGISSEEMQAFAAAGVKTATLGKRILRCETAPLCAISIAMALTGNME